jgi:hypothetical protein
VHLKPDTRHLAPDPSPEDALCLLLAQARLTPEALREASELVALPLRWDALLARAAEQQVIPLVYRHLRALGFKGVPEPTRLELKQAFAKNRLKNALLVQQLVRVLRLLAASGVRAIPVKGLALADSLYGNFAMRYVSDLDILVPPGQALAARRALIAHGYESPFPEWFFRHFQFRTNPDCWLWAREPRRRHLVELHWRVLEHTSRGREATEDLWAEARPALCFGAPAYALSAEWEFLYVAWHASGESPVLLKWLADVHDLGANRSIDWEKVWEKAERFEVARPVEKVLNIVEELFDGPAPQRFSARPLPARARFFPAGAGSRAAPTALSPRACMFPAAAEGAGASPVFPVLRSMGRPSERLRWLARMLFVVRENDEQLFHLPPSLSLLYYALRPLRLLSQWSRRSLRARP